MVGVIRRMNRLTELLVIRHGPGAAVLPSEVTRIHMEFAHKWNDGHMGPRKFWRDCLPRLKYWNPAIPMIVNRTRDQAGPAVMSVYFREAKPSSNNTDTNTTTATATSAVTPRTNMPSSSSDGNSPAPPPAENERVITIQMKDVRSDIILRDFLQRTGAVPVVPTPQEEANMREVADRGDRAAADRETMRVYLEAQRREASMMAQARNEAAAFKAAAAT